MAKKMISLRLADLTAHQLSELGARWGTQQTETVALCVERAYQEAMVNQNDRTGTRTYKAHRISVTMRRYDDGTPGRWAFDSSITKDGAEVGGFSHATTPQEAWARALEWVDQRDD
jgi:hypothetical protein